MLFIHLGTAVILTTELSHGGSRDRNRGWNVHKNKTNKKEGLAFDHVTHRDLGLSKVNTVPRIAFEYTTSRSPGISLNNGPCSAVDCIGFSHWLHCHFTASSRRMILTPSVKVRIFRNVSTKSTIHLSSFTSYTLRTDHRRTFAMA